MESLSGILVLFLLGLGVFVLHRLQKVNQRINRLSSSVSEQSYDVIIRSLLERVYRLEMVVQQGIGAPAAPSEHATTGVAPASPPLPETPRPEPIPVQAAPFADEATEPAVHVALTPSAPAAPMVAPTISQEPSLVAICAKWIREHAAGEEWEAVIGGSWLNKLGVLVLVIGLGLFLGYSLTHLGPAGRVATGLVVSGLMLGGGITLERRVRYVIFARGIIGGGWAALYFTTYAMHALEAARIIRHPLVGMALLGVAAAGIILHSLRYRSEVVTGLAYFVGFVTIAISPVSVFSAIASVPLVGSLLFVAHRFSWVSMATGGVILTYATYAVRYGVNLPPDAFLAGFPIGQAALATHWLLIEAFDLLEVRKHRQSLGIVRTIFPLNACGFIGVSLLQWSGASPTTLPLFFAAAAVAYLVSTNVRARVRPPSSFPQDTGLLKRALAGGYEAAVTLAVALATSGIFLRFSGPDLSIAFLLEGEFLFLAGLLLGQPYLRALAAPVFALPVLKLVLLDLGTGGQVAALGREVLAWTPVALLMAAVFYLNRRLARPDGQSRLLVAEVGFSYTASALLALILGFEIPREFLGLAWLALAAPLFELGVWKRLKEFRLQAYGTASLSLAALVLANVLTQRGETVPSTGLSLTIAALLLYAATTHLIRLPDDRIPTRERLIARQLSSWAGTILLGALAWHVLPPEVLGLGWLALALPLFELGLRKELQELRIQAYAVGALSLGTLFVVNTFGLGSEPAGSPWISLGPAAFAMYAVTARLLRPLPKHLLNRERLSVRDISSAAGTVLVAALLWHVLPTPVVALGWGVQSLLLIESGLALPLPALRLQGNLVALLVFGRLFLANFTGTGETAGISHRILTVLPVILLFYYFWARLRVEGGHGDLLPWELRLRPFYLYAPALLIVVLIRFELGRVLAVVGWALFGLVLLSLGLRRDNRDLRWQSYILAFLTFMRSWATNFYVPESLAGMPARILTGAVVIGSFYGAQLLSRRRPQDGRRVSGGWLRRFLTHFDVNAGIIFSLLATTLLTVLLFYEVSGSLLTVAWGLEGLALLATGFPLRERVLRLSGLLLLGACILKVFVYDLRELEPLPRIGSFIVLGIVLLGVSLIYTRFREQIRQYL